MPIKNQIIYFALCIGLALNSIGADAQGTRIEYGVDTVNSLGKYDRIYQMVSEQKVDVNTLLKFDAVQWGQIQPSFTIEHRLWHDLTIEPNITASSFGWTRDGGIDFAFNPNLEFKYYFNRARRERQGKNVIGFSADYFLIGFSYTLTDDKGFFTYQLDDNHLVFEGGVEALTDNYYSFTSWRVMYGIQRKIGNMAYADFAFGGEKHYFNDFGNSKIIPTLKVKLGFALSREQLKRFSR